MSSFLRCWCWLIFIFFFSSFPFSISIWTSFASSCLFLVGTMLSPRFRFLLRLVEHVTCILIRTYVRHPFIVAWDMRFVSAIVCIVFCFNLFSSWGNLPIESYWSLSCDHGLHCSHDSMWEQEQRVVSVSYQVHTKKMKCLFLPRVDA